MWWQSNILIYPHYRTHCKLLKVHYQTLLFSFGKNSQVLKDLCTLNQNRQVLDLFHFLNQNMFFHYLTESQSV